MGEREVLSSSETAQAGLKFQRFFTQAGVSPYERVEWERRTASISNEKGEVVFEQHNVEVPADWSQTATNIVASKYFHGQRGTPERETSVRQLVGRVADTLAQWGHESGYFATTEDRDIFRDELAYMLLHQMVAFNSPVWFNVGVQSKPQCSACFINSIKDDMDSIMSLAKTEGMLFKWGSGTGTNFSALRGSMEVLSGGGIASGPVSFMKGFDAFAGVIKSGGKTRRAAKMVILNVDHPDIEEFINSKAKEERKAWGLMGLGYDSSLDGEAYGSVFFQNANHSVRVTDDFMQAAVEERAWWTKSVRTGQPLREYRARDLLRQMAEAAHQCGDPGIQYDTTINRWHTCKATGRINASNPCSEYMFLDDTACNLASFNLMRFVDAAGNFDAAAYRHAVDVVITGMEIIIDNAGYPTEKITRNSHEYRPLGLGYANLGALLMTSGVPYDSDQSRDIAGAITALTTGQACLTSARIAEVTGPFPGYTPNRDSMLGVISMHRDALRGIKAANVQPSLLQAAQEAWDRALSEGKKHGYRNAQATVIAPTGTIAFMMDCDTTGIEPDLALVKYKRLVGGGVIKIVNNTVPMALQKLDYAPDEISDIVDHIDRTGTIEGARHLKPEHLPVFDCSLKPSGGVRSIHHSGHLKMMAAVQPFVSGAISKTVNMPESTTVEEIMDAYVEAWRRGLKAVAIYRDGSKKVQPLSTTDRAPQGQKEPAAAAAVPTGRLQRHKLPETRDAVTHKFSIAGHEGYITVGLYPDGQPGEIFITMAKEGSTLSGVMDSFACAISIALQYGVPLKIFVDKLSHVRFEPSGFTNNPEIPVAKSIIDYIFRWLGGRFISPEYKTVDLGVTNGEGMVESLEPSPSVKAAAEISGAEAGNLNIPAPVQVPADAPVCAECGSLMTRNGSCFKCHNCGGTSGCS
ncbi:MAG TPA: vitamin B12-dependent ribonucleotide reductase [Candidatus Acidoferrales bacterium]|nr:vitamin B12-dependent ribonucleotide reductase [Candidatus Acidoferrales bacterium]